MKLCIRNVGEINLQALFLLGASTKDGQDKIGFFGSGNKYAMATLLRKGIPFSIYSGERLIEITTQRAIFGGQVFQQIVIDGQPTSFTTRMGPSWETWFAIREFYCNAIDEGEASWNMVEGISPEARYTKIYIEATPEIMDFWAKRNQYILDGTDAPIWAFDGSHGRMEVYEPAPGAGSPTSKVFRKGVLVWESADKCVFWYNADNIEINEARKANYEFEVLSVIAQSLARASDVKYVERIIEAMNQRSYVENRAYWQYLEDDDHFSDPWVEAIGTKTVIRSSSTAYLPPEDVASGFVLHDSAVAKLEKDRPELNYRHHMSQDFRETELTETQKEWLENAKDELKRYGYWNDEYKVLFGEFKTENLMGLCAPLDGLIKVSIKHMALGYDELCCTLIEEMMHTEGYKDASRSMEQHLMHELLWAKRRQRAVEQYGEDAPEYFI